MDVIYVKNGARPSECRIRDRVQAFNDRLEARHHVIDTCRINPPQCIRDSVIRAIQDRNERSPLRPHGPSIRRQRPKQKDVVPSSAIRGVPLKPAARFLIPLSRNRRRVSDIKPTRKSIIGFVIRSGGVSLREPVERLDHTRTRA